MIGYQQVMHVLFTSTVSDLTELGPRFDLKKRTLICNLI